jgi:hypothetical protein
VERGAQRKQPHDISALFVKSASSSSDMLSSNSSIMPTRLITLGKDKVSGSRQSTDRARSAIRG